MQDKMLYIKVYKNFSGRCLNKQPMALELRQYKKKFVWFEIGVLFHSPVQWVKKRAKFQNKEISSGNPVVLIWSFL